MSRIEQLQSRYTHIEAEITSLWPGSFSAACANCTDICCRPHMAEEVLQSFWLGEIATKAHGKNWHLENTAPKCAALSHEGCMLKAGKPPFCFAFYCETLLNDIPSVELVSYLFLSLILSDLCRLNRRKNLLTLSEKEVYESLDLIENKIQNAEGRLSLYRRFLDADDNGRPLVALQMVAEIPQILTASSRRAILENI